MKRKILTLFFLCFCFLNFNCREKGHGLVDITKRIKGKIDPTDAKNMREYYKKNKEHFKVVYLNGTTRVVDTLEGFRLDTADIREMLEYAPGKKASSIILYFGRNPNNIEEGLKKHPSYTIIVMPIDGNNKLVQLAYDKADPCPPYCPDEN